VYESESDGRVPAIFVRMIGIPIAIFSWTLGRTGITVLPHDLDLELVFNICCLGGEAIALILVAYSILGMHLRRPTATAP
jgi:hypothetical protein